MTETLPKVDPRRLARFLREVGEIGADPRGGWTRLAFGPEERAAHAIFERVAAFHGVHALRVRLSKPDVYPDAEAVGVEVASFAGLWPDA